MLTVTQAFQRYLTTLELTEAERSEAIRQHQVVRENLRTRLGGIQEDFLAGSYKRRTAIRPLHDIDVFLVLEERTHGAVRALPPAACLERVRAALSQAYQGKVPTRLQGRSVNIEFAGTGIGYDIVPAFQLSPELYIIPDRERQSWIRTNPRKHEEACIAANERAGSKLNALIKAAKRWKDLNRVPIASFHLEVMAYEAFRSAPATYAEGLGALFQFLAQRVLSPCPEPAGVGPAVDHGMGQPERTVIREHLVKAGARAAQALALDGAGRTEEAHAHWRALCGGDYPEQGRA
jgi:Second Messenger Oligonucleotide or Dinucleotide Synthetase domain